MKYTLESIQYDIKVASPTAAKLNSPDQVAEILYSGFNPMQEEMYLLMMDTKNAIIDKYLIAKGAGNSVIVTPSEVIRPLLLTNGNRAILAHNHPSGDITPSEDDIVFTKKIKKAFDILGLALLDHVIYSSDEHYSFKKKGLL